MKFTKCLLAIIIAASTSHQLAASTGGRIVKNINFGWRFMPGDRKGAEAVDFSDKDWTEINVPHDFQIHQPWVAPSPDEKADLDNPMANVKSRLSPRGFKDMGVGWYRRELTPDEAWKGKRVLLDFEGVLLVGDVFLNGERIGGTDYGYLGFEMDVTDKLKYGEPNIIAVRADTGTPENSRWYTGAGIYRDVKVIVTDPKHYFTRHPLRITTPEVSEGRWSVVIEAELATFFKTDSIRAAIRLTDPNGKEIYDATKAHWQHPRQHVREFKLDSIPMDDVMLWDCDNPNLYTAEVSLIKPDGTVADKVTERFGIRSIEFSPDFGFKLNGKKMLLKGIANHHTLGALGAAAYPRAIEKYIQLLKEFGFNHIRTSHNPYSESFLDLCDEYGILVVDELYDKWMTSFAGGRKPWMELWPHDVPEWVKRDRNHPSVVFWSLGNELQLVPDMPYNDWGITPYRLQKVLIDRFDGLRPVTVAMHPRGRNELTDSLPAPLVTATDIASYNYRYMYFPGDSKRFPWMMFYQSEATADGIGPNFYEMNLDKVIGLAYWGLVDYFGESLGWPEKGWSKGVFDISLEPKPAAYLLKSIFKPDEPLVRIAVVDSDDNTEWNGVKVGTKSMSSHWNRREGCKLNIVTYTNADEVELLINGRSLGRKVNDRSNPRGRNKISWNEVPYQKGRVEARAYNGGKPAPVASHTLETSGRASKLTLNPDNDNWRADGTDLQHVVVTACDKKGRRDYGASHKITFAVEGPAEIVGVINGDIASDELSVGNSRRLHNGAAVVILRSKHTPGQVTLKATSDDPKIKQVVSKMQVSECK
ncbi:MAG: DUF4982 domain-containing protein [Muribaculaceae bacterium]|nr:DUF4982 domain-containing protein [Muribaculaceae bacterium]